MEKMNEINELAMKYGGGGVTQLNSLSIAFTIVMILLVICLHRRYVFLPILLTSIFMTLEQRIVLFSLDFMIIRIIVIFGLLRLVLKDELKLYRRNELDTVVFLWILSSVISYTFLYQTKAAFINRGGFALDAFGIYIIIRSTIKDLSDVKIVIKSFLYVATILAVFMIIEYTTERNLFSIFGGVPEFTAVRDGRLRCQGAFTHALNAGAFGASLMPLTLTLLGKESTNKKLGVAGFVAATMIALLSSSSAPIGGYLAGVFVLCMWRYRRHLRIFLRIGVIGIIFFHLVMKAPVWSLIGRVKFLGASTGWHRYILIDRFINHFSEWWLCGTKLTGHWGYGMWDITNTYIQVGVKGGLLTLILFILVILYCFRTLGQALEVSMDKSLEWLFWGVGATMFTHAVMFMGMSYFDQIKFIWYMHVAMISTINSGFIKLNKAAFRHRL